MFLDNTNIINSLERDIENNSYSHAYLFYGTKGIGKLSHAKNFARQILEENPEGIRFFSGIDDYESADLSIIKSDTSIKKKEIEELIDKTFNMPFKGDHKVVIIDDFDKVTVEGQNALLKTLEEPMDYLILILISNSIKKILPTIKSRCRILKFKDISSDRIEKMLLEEGVSESNARLFSRLCNGSVSLALKYTKDPEIVAKKDEIIKILDLIIRSETFIFKYIDFFKDNKDRLDEILNFMLIWYLDLIYIKTNREDKIMNIDKSNILKLQDVSIDRAIKSYDAIINAMKRSEKNINFDLNIQQLLMEIGGVRW